MNIKKIKFQKSFILTCTRHFIVYSLILVLLYITLSTFIQLRLTRAFPAISDLLSYKDALAHDDFSGIPGHRLKQCGFIVFADDGRQIYASDHELSQHIASSDVSVINSYDGTFYTVFETFDTDGQPGYLVTLNEASREDSAMVRNLASCTLDKDYHILSGGLFPERSALTQKEFLLLQGTYKKNQTIEKYEYKNSNGEPRVLVFTAPRMSSAAYDRVLAEGRSLWLLAIPVILAAIIIEAFLFTRKIRKSIAPLNHAIAGYRPNVPFEVEPASVPREFMPTVRNFSRLIERLEKVQKEKEQLYQNRQQMIADISHDLKTPLTVIQGYSRAFLEHMIPEDKKEKYLTAIYQRSVLAAGLIDTLFEYVRMERPGFKPSMENFDFSEFVKTALAETYSDIENAGFRLNARLSDTPVMLLGDPKLLRRLLENLLRNALKYNPAGTTIFVTLERGPQHICLTIADDGCGIPESIADIIFQPFVTGSSARTSGEGTGLGLAIARQITELCGGTIHLVTPPSKPYATEFRIIFPAQPTKGTSSAPPASCQ